VEKNVQPDRSQMTSRMRIACLITKATHTHTHTHTHIYIYIRIYIHTHTICNTDRFSTATMVARTRLNVTLHVHCLSC